ncbi:dolichol-phosphate mannosyltransferase subunit 3, putative [Plasmodium yoelii]|uniref:Dolichol-phosphate mannosyltransferase subunit 3 n=2 Tax=Plasmodium yoelii TaxID=5861 RepID=A0AAE9WZZ9_PLAYO|nr:dolichol-phosphate mannosyltransferase subunit 3, putative [Plasmodium yoelii]WBY59537.1 dolichol-phosphate mannosyltransferase subunit 3 [Plasmodium yoelii yoelii]VTZ80282.1 dolichol-phosphate mannosyltransferase subunit 3, putative [Plasmodium yoelii]|eukprot:XP_034493575.1 dolichol-phosphate mannosyltransferase subunit 3, putative [Plasmodium yoelii]
MQLTKGKVVVIILLFSTILWIYKFDKYKKSDSLYKWILIPLYLIFTLGVYALVSISISIYNVNIIPHDQNTLLEELDAIKRKLQMKNFTFT